jgi:Fic family protein
MLARDEFEFLNSPIWLDYTQQRYLSPEEIRYRLKQQERLPANWADTEKKVVVTRKVGAIPLFLQSINTKFWFFPSDSLTRKIDEIERLGQELHRQINKQSLFRQEFLLDSTIEEAITSAIYEGAHSTRAQAQQLIASGDRPKSKDEWMLVNNFKAMSWVQAHRDEQLSQRIILELHRIVTENTMEGDDANFSGKFRNDKVFIGPHEGIPHELIQRTIDEMITLVTQNPRYIHPLLRGILVHYFTAYIHPFFDGNGRTARALFYFKAMRNQLDYLQLLSVSAYLKEHGTQYQKTFEKVVANDHDVTYFIDFCLDSIHSALEAVSKKVKYLLRINELRDRISISANQIGLLQRMALNKFRMVSIEEYAAQIQKSREIARQELKALTDHGLVQEEKQGKKLVYRINKPRLEAILGAAS